MPPKTKGAPPHHLGHRQRLRARFLQAPDAVPEYELLELLLCLTIPRRDVKGDAKDLIAHFGSLGDVLAAEPARLSEYGLGETTIAAPEDGAGRGPPPRPRRAV